jgi:hypothetical protein
MLFVSGVGQALLKDGDTEGHVCRMGKWSLIGEYMGVHGNTITHDTRNNNNNNNSI